jgi:putative tryptophan/tyrosine transport system substrate-binding protein
VLHRKPIVTLATQYKLPAVYFARYFVEEGGLLSYGPDFTDGYGKPPTTLTASLKGVKPGELPGKYKLIINAKNRENFTL